MKLLLALAFSAQAAWFGAGAPTIEEPRRLFEAGQYKEVVGRLSGTEIGRMRVPDQKQAYLYLGMSHERLGAMGTALGVYQLGAKLFPKDLNILTQLAMVLHHTDLEESARPVFEKVLSIHPNNAVANLGLAEIDYALGFLDRSAEHYDKALETMADNPAVWRDYATVLLGLRDFRTAELAARRSAMLQEKPETLWVQARAQRGDKRLGEALLTLARVVELAPGEDRYALALALWRLEDQDFDGALKLVEKPLKAENPSPLAFWVRARVRLKRGLLAQALEDLRAAASDERAAPFVAAAANDLLRRLELP